MHMTPESTPESDAEAVRSYAIRRVNPFLGVLQVIESRAGRAITANGVVWDIEVRTEHSGGWGRLNQNNLQQVYYRYGLWSLQDGLVNRPLAPHLDTDPLKLQCISLIKCIQERIEQLPFGLEDSRELWLFDSANERPIALLASVTARDDLPTPEPRHWSCYIGANGIPSQRKYPDAHELEAQVKHAAGFNIHKHWITRQDDGSGIIDGSDRPMKAEEFPAFLLSEHWPEPIQRQRARAYFDWIAPSLLTLQGLSRNQRQGMEKSLSMQAESVEYHCHLYPSVISEKYLRAAIVQSRIQKANRV